MKVPTSNRRNYRHSQTPALFHRIPLVFALALAISLSVLVQPASAITRTTVLSRANHWVAMRVGYSQTSYFQGYRRDCSGFVSMAWHLKGSYTTRTLGARSTRVAISSLRAGDAVLIPGHHVSIFGGWKNKRLRTFIAVEESTSGKPALRHVRHVRSGAVGIRFKGIVEHPRVLVASIVRPVPAAVSAISVVIPRPPLAATVATPAALIAAADASAIGVNLSVESFSTTPAR